MTGLATDLSLGSTRLMSRATSTSKDVRRTIVEGTAPPRTRSTNNNTCQPEASRSRASRLHLITMNEGSKGPPDTDEKKRWPNTCREGDRIPGELNPLTTLVSNSNATKMSRKAISPGEHTGRGNLQKKTTSISVVPMRSAGAPPQRGEAMTISRLRQQARKRPQNKFSSISPVPMESARAPPLGGEAAIKRP